VDFTVFRMLIEFEIGCPIFGAVLSRLRWVVVPRSVVEGGESVGIFAAAKIAHLIRFASKMGHPK